MQTLLLDTLAWDLTVDTAGNIAVASNPYSQTQDAASAIRTFEGEVYYDTTLGIPYFTQILGFAPPTSLMKAYFNSAALSVPGVTKAQTFITSWEDRVVSGQVQIMNEDSQVSATGF